MPARLDLALTRRLALSFPNGTDWQIIHAQRFVRDRRENLFSDWSSIKHLEGVGGVYAVLLPARWFEEPRVLKLHAPHNHKGEMIPFEFTVPALVDGYGVVYLGRTSNLSQRWKGHLSNGEKKDGGQVKYGLFECGLYPDGKSALKDLRAHGRFIYTILPNPENCANRDVLEMALLARFGAPFNIKSEH